MFTQLLNFGQTLKTKAISVVLASDAGLPAGESHIGQVGMNTVNIEASLFTRPDNATPYSANDVVGPNVAAVITFTGAARANAGSGNIVKARLVANSATGMLGAVLRLWVYKVAPTPIADNSPYTLLWADRANRIGYIDFPALTTEGTGSDSCSSLWSDMPLNFTTGASDSALYGVLEIKTVGAAPIAQQQFGVFLNIEQH
jgi:hypothetical protein